MTPWPVLLVLPQGIGKLLVKTVEEIVKGWGYDEAILEVEESNKAARDLYKVSGRPHSSRSYLWF